MKCAKCGTEHNGQFCPECGTPAGQQPPPLVSKKPWYLHAWFICILFALWPTLISPIVGIVLLVLSYQYDKHEQERVLNIAKEYVDSRLSAADSEMEAKLAVQRDLEAKIKKDMNNLEIKHTQKKKDLEREENELITEIARLQSECLVKSVEIEAYEDMKSEDIKTQLQLHKLEQSEMVRAGTALRVTFAMDKREMAAQKKQILRCFNAETGSIISGLTLKNIDASRSKLQKSFETINRIFELDGVQLSSEYLKSALDEMTIIYAYLVRQEEERELARSIREQMQEEEKVRREIDREKQKLEKEELQFRGEVNKLMGYLQKATDDVERKLYLDKIQELEGKLKLLEKDKENVFEREQNTRAGFVYIISNIGSFGENIYKIGMTRRLEPMDRVKELSDASVPFTFDVHAMIFSSDAPALESVLHQTFRDHQVNKVNSRKEFFNADLSEVKRIVKENHNATVQFIDIPDAVEYRESLRLQGSVAS